MNRHEYTAHAELVAAANDARARRAADERLLAARNAVQRYRERQRIARRFAFRLLGIEAAIVAVLSFIR